MHRFRCLSSTAAKHFSAALLLACLFSGAVQAADTPAMLSGTKLVSAEEVVKAIASGAVAIDTRIASEYADGHIKGAISIPYRERSVKAANFDATQDQFNLGKLPDE